MSDLPSGRRFLRHLPTRSGPTPDQVLGQPPPPLSKSPGGGLPRIALPEVPPDLGKMSLSQAIRDRRSRRDFSPMPVTLEELAYLLWATQGIRAIVSKATATRFVPSAGSRHAFETYLVVLRVTGLDPGLYRFLPFERQLLALGHRDDLAVAITAATMDQAFAGQAAVTFVWSAIPYRTEWRYGVAAHKYIAIDAGHVGQDLYLACEALGLATCAIGAYDQDLMDALLGVDGRDELAVYTAPVGRRA